jgi:hypothetical protein
MKVKNADAYDDGMTMMKQRHEPGPPMTLGNMRE